MKREADSNKKRDDEMIPVVQNEILSISEIEDLRQKYRHLIEGFFALNGRGAYDAVIENLMGELVNIERLNEKRKNNLSTINGGFSCKD